MDTFNILKEKFKEINNKGYIKSVNNYKNGGGLTLESELESTGGDFNIPDFYDIEIKSAYKFRFQDLELFNSAPDGKHFPAAPWLSEQFGYPDKDYKNIKVFKGNVFGNKFNYIGLRFEYKLHIDRLNQKIVLNIYKNRTLINNDIYWDFDSLKEKLERKDRKIALFIFNKKKIGPTYYYKYEQLMMYELKNFDTFLDLIENGIVFVTFKTGVHKSGKYVGTFSDHGTAFRIEIKNIRLLFNEVK